MSVINTRNITIGSGGVEYQVGVLHSGTLAERDAYNAQNGDEWNVIDESTGNVTQYLYSSGTWVFKTQGQEFVTVSVSSSDGNLDLSTVRITYRVDNVNTTLTPNANGDVYFNIEIGKTYTVSFSRADNYDTINSISQIAMNSQRTISRIYIYIGNQIRNVILERSNESNWETSGPEAVITQNILNKGRIPKPAVGFEDGDLTKPIYNDSDSDLPLSSEMTEDDLPGSYVIDPINKIYAKLDPSNGQRFIDGNNWDISKGDAFRHIPRIYYHITKNSDNEPVLSVSASEQSTNEVDWKYWPNSWYGSYKCTTVNGKQRSRPNGLTFTNNQTMYWFWTQAQNLSQDYGLVNYEDRSKLIALFYSLYGRADSQAKFGTGINVTYNTGTTGGSTSLGDASGSVGTNQYNRLFGIEQLWGSAWEFAPGIWFNGSTAHVYRGNACTDNNGTIHGIIEQQLVNGQLVNERTFIKLQAGTTPLRIEKMVLDSKGEGFCEFIASQGTTNSNASGADLQQYYCDAYWWSASGQILLCGGTSDHALRGGLAAAAADVAFSATVAARGARLAFRGDISTYTYVTGSVFNQYASN